MRNDHLLLLTVRGHGPMIHRKRQFDLECWPIIAVHWQTANRSKRIFCLWRRGIEIGPLLATPHTGMWKGRRYLWRRKRG